MTKRKKRTIVGWMFDIWMKETKYDNNGISKIEVSRVKQFCDDKKVRITIEELP